MNTSNNIVKLIMDKFKKNSEFEFIAGLEDLTIADIDYIEELSITNNDSNKLTYQIVDNTYIKIDYSLQSIC